MHYVGERDVVLGVEELETRGLITHTEGWRESKKSDDNTRKYMFAETKEIRQRERERERERGWRRHAPDDVGGSGGWS